MIQVRYFKDSPVHCTGSTPNIVAIADLRNSGLTPIVTSVQLYCNCRTGFQTAILLHDKVIMFAHINCFSFASDLVAKISVAAKMIS